MKCVKVLSKDGLHTVVLRLPNDEAAKLVNEGKATYVPKSAWKAGGRK